MSTGDLLVRPSFIEANVRRGPTPSLQQHRLSTYGRTMAAIIRAQFGAHKGRGGGREAVQWLLECRYVQALLHSAAGLRVDSLARLSSVGTDAKFSTQLDSMEAAEGSGELLPSASA